jgi:hypothetical protein
MVPGESAKRVAQSAVRGSARRRGAHGFAYLWLLFLVAALGVSLAAGGVLWELRVRREKEADLLAIGNEFRRAIGDYYRLTPQAAKELPAKLDDLVLDRRGPAPRRHLRRIYRDPLTGQAAWGLVAVEGRISGVYSLAPGVPVKQGGFGDEDSTFEGARRYADWRFVIAVTPPATAAAPPGAPAAPTAPSPTVPNPAPPAAANAPAAPTTER